MKRIIWEFIGGDWDGKILDSEASEDAEDRREAVHLYKTTNEGELGKGQWYFTPAQVRRIKRRELDIHDIEFDQKRKHQYKIVDRREDDETVRLRIEYFAYDSDAKNE